MRERNVGTQRILFALALLLAMLTPIASHAESVTVAWDANPEPDVVGYYVFIGTASGFYSTVADVGNGTFVTLTGTATDDIGVTSVTWANGKGGSGMAAGTTVTFTAAASGGLAPGPSAT